MPDPPAMRRQLNGKIQSLYTRSNPAGARSPLYCHEVGLFLKGEFTDFSAWTEQLFLK